MAGLFHSYFDGEADGKDDAALSRRRRLRGRAADPAARLERRVPEARGRAARCPFLPSLFASRLAHKPSRLGQGHDLARGHADRGQGAGGRRSRPSSRRWPRRAGQRPRTPSRPRRPIGCCGARATPARTRCCSARRASPTGRQNAPGRREVPVGAGPQASSRLAALIPPPAAVLNCEVFVGASRFRRER